MAGKIHNLRLAVRRIDGIEIPAGEVFSFWRQVGRTTRRRGFVSGRELREGCIIPSIGGGLCQLSNALYDAALKAGLEIIERHPHTQVIAGSLAESGRDATVFWNYVDLRFRTQTALRIEAHLDENSLTIKFRGTKCGAPAAVRSLSRPASHLNNCASCGEIDCFRGATEQTDIEFGRSAFLVDEFSPEFDRYVQQERSPDDVLFVPLDGKRFGKANYAWSFDGFRNVRQSITFTAVRSLRSRRLAAQGAARQRDLLANYRKLAEIYARWLSHDVMHITVQQNLLPFLWENGELGGRTFDVLMTALPMGELQTRLDRAAALHPESTTLGDFRADDRLVALEAVALRHARRIITPHSEIAKLFPRRAHRLEWVMPKAENVRKISGPRPSIVFPAATVGRKGCYELREATRGMDVQIVLLGPDIEGRNFWSGRNMARGSGNWREIADMVVLPAFVEHRPRRILQAIAYGIPVIASEACGVEGLPGVTTVRAGDAVELREAIITHLAERQVFSA
jgi:hypothetical protein